MKKLKLNKKIFICFGMAFCMLGLSACSKPQEVYKAEDGTTYRIDSNEMVYKETLEQFVEYMDNHDAEGIKSLMAKGVLAEDKDIDSQIERLFQFYDESSTMTTINHALDSGSHESKSAHYGVIVKELGDWFYIYTEDNVYVCDATVCLRDDTDEIGTGIVQVSIMTTEVMVNDEVSFPAEDGLNIIEDTDGEYNIRIVGGTAFDYTEIDRELTVEEIKAFLEKETGLKEFYDEFGEPNVDGGYRIIYEVLKENDEYRYVFMFVDEELNRIKKAYVEDEYDTSALYCIYDSNED